MSNTVKMPSSIMTVTISSLLMGDQRAVMLQSKIRGIEQKWTIVQLPARDVINERELPSFAFMSRIQVLDERYWKFPEVEADMAMVYIALRPYNSTDDKYRDVVVHLIGDVLFNAYFNGYRLKLSSAQVENIVQQLNADVSGHS